MMKFHPVNYLSVAAALTFGFLALCGVALAQGPAAPNAAAIAAAKELVSLKGAVTITATPAIAAVRGIDLDALQRSEVADFR